jgi:hypothetical protein
MSGAEVGRQCPFDAELLLQSYRGSDCPKAIREVTELTMWWRSFRSGDWVVFRRAKTTTHPGPRARDVQATTHGDDYSYFVDKFWIVDAVLPDGNLLLRTRRGKTHTIRADDPNLRHATLWERLRYRARFIELASTDRPK